MGIGEATPVTNFAFLCFRLSPQPFLPVGIGEATPVGMWVGDARNISRCRRPLRPSWQRLGRYLYLALTLTLALVNA